MKNIMLAGLGAYSLTRERIEEMVSDLVNRGNVKENEAEALIENLSAKAEHERSVLKELVREQLAIASSNLGIVTHEHIQDLARRLDRIESLFDQ